MPESDFFLYKHHDPGSVVFEYVRKFFKSTSRVGPIVSRILGPFAATEWVDWRQDAIIKGT